MSEEPNLIQKIIAWEEEQKAKGVELGPTVGDYVNEIAEAIKDSNKRVAKMIHAECIEQMRRNSGYYEKRSKKK